MIGGPGVPSLTDIDFVRLTDTPGRPVCGPLTTTACAPCSATDLPGRAHRELAQSR